MTYERKRSPASSGESTRAVRVTGANSISSPRSAAVSSALSYFQPAGRRTVGRKVTASLATPCGTSTCWFQTTTRRCSVAFGPSP